MRRTTTKIAVLTAATTAALAFSAGSASAETEVSEPSTFTSIAPGPSTRPVTTTARTPEAPTCSAGR